MKNTIQNTSGTTTRTVRTAFGTRRLVVGAASVVAAGALIGVGAQGAFAASGDTGASGSGSATATATATTPEGSATAGGSASGSASANVGSAAELGHTLFAGHLDGAKAQKLAKRVIADGPLFSLLPSSLQGDLKTLASAPAKERTADAKKIASTALSGGYGSAIKTLATELKGAHGDEQKLDLQGLRDGLRTVGGSDAVTQLSTDAAGVASTVGGDSQLASKLPATLRSDLSRLASAPATQRAADVQDIANSALTGGYGVQLQQLAVQIEQQVTASH